MINIREHDQYIPRNTVRAGCINEYWLFFNELNKSHDAAKVRQALLDGLLLGNYAYNTRYTLWKVFRTRYLTIPDQWVTNELISASQGGPQSPEFVSLLYLYFILRDKLAFDFVTDVVWGKWKKHDLLLQSVDFGRFFDELSQEHRDLLKITASTKKKLISNTISTLTDFGLTTTGKHRTISRPPVVPQTAFHLVRLLKLEGLSGKEIVEAKDWRIFLWDQQDVSRMLTKLSQEKRIRYEKSGNIVNLEISVK
jgi:hypothetical protein